MPGLRGGGLRAPRARAMRALSFVALAALCTAASQRRALDVGNRRRWHRVQHGHCSYTFVLPEAEPSPCPLAVPGPVNALQRDSPSGSGQAARGATQRLQHLERILENSTQWLLKVGNGEGVSPVRALSRGLVHRSAQISSPEPEPVLPSPSAVCPEGVGGFCACCCSACCVPLRPRRGPLLVPVPVSCQWSWAPYSAQLSLLTVRMWRCREAAGKAFGRRRGEGPKGRVRCVPTCGLHECSWHWVRLCMGNTARDLPAPRGHWEPQAHSRGKAGRRAPCAMDPPSPSQGPLAALPHSRPLRVRQEEAFPFRGLTRHLLTSHLCEHQGRATSLQWDLSPHGCHPVELSDTASAA